MGTNHAKACDDLPGLPRIHGRHWGYRNELQDATRRLLHDSASYVRDMANTLRSWPVDDVDDQEVFDFFVNGDAAALPGVSSRLAAALTTDPDESLGTSAPWCGVWMALADRRAPLASSRTERSSLIWLRATIAAGNAQPSEEPAWKSCQPCWLPSRRETAPRVCRQIASSLSAGVTRSGRFAVIA